MANDVIIALDFPGKDETMRFLDLFQDKKPYVKIGMELFYSMGPDAVREIKSRGHKIFLDLKLHDIPNTVKSAMSVLSALDVDMTNLHATGGSAMMKAAIDGLTRPDGSRPLLIAVTQLTSTSSEMLRGDLLIEKPMEQVVSHYAQTAMHSGLDGVVCSPLEVEAVKACCSQQFLTVTPGIRFEGGEAGDQVRITTPQRAREIGSDYIVVGRPITRDTDPVGAYKRACVEFLGE